jgi:pSer/pThr/pTyr-binding forkhead associated (FHA) protein
MDTDLQGFEANDTVRTVGCLTFNSFGIEKIITLENFRVVIGRSKLVTIHINELTASKMHAVIYSIGGKFFIKYFFSKNGTKKNFFFFICIIFLGTFLNSKRITATEELDTAGNAINPLEDEAILRFI